MKCQEIIKVLEELAPASLACDWDNVGLLVGSHKKEVHKIYIALDVTEETIQNAIAFKADMLITHHPLIFHPLKKITDEYFISERVYELIRHDISYYAMHTNFDIAPGCMADLVSQKLGLLVEGPLEITCSREEETLGIGKIGTLLEEMTLKELAVLVKKQFQLEKVEVYGTLDSDVSVWRVAVCPGSGKSVIKDAIEQNAQVLITGDIGYHEGMDSAAQGLRIIDAGHYGLEYLFVPFMKDYLENKLKDVVSIAAAVCSLPSHIL